MFAGQFVPVKIVTKGKEWSDWNRKYPSEGNSIPVLYVVRADGHSLYAKSGSLSGDDLPKMLYATLEMSGRILGAGELDSLTDTVNRAEYQLKQKNHGLAAKAISRAKRIGTLGQLGSFASASVRADEIVDELSKFAADKLANAAKAITPTDAPFEDVLEIVGVKTFYSDLPLLKQDLRNVTKRLQSNDQAKQQVKPAELLVRARQSAKSEKKSDLKRSERFYTQIIEKYAGTPAAQFAREELAEINPQSPGLNAIADAGVVETGAVEAPSKRSTSEGETDTTDDTPERITKGATKSEELPVELRMWKSSDGIFTVEAQLIERSEDSIRLRKQDGVIVTVPLENLSEADRDYLNNQSSPQRQNR